MSSSLPIKDIYYKIRQKDRISSKDALILLREAPWLEIAQLAWEQRINKMGADTASYTVFRIINYTNVCSIGCSFCSFKCTEDDGKAYVLSPEQVFALIDESIPKGCDQVFFQGGVNPDLPLEYYLEVLQGIKNKYGFHIRGFSPVELKHMAVVYHLKVPELIEKLKAAGLDSVPGAGAEILAERVRKILAPQKCTTEEWVEIIKQCHQKGLSGSANIVFGSVETDEEIIEHLRLVRKIQDETGGFNSFIPWTFQSQTKDFYRKTVKYHEYLKILALCRLFLDNIDNLEVSVMVLGKEIGQLALRMGANDISSPVLEEKVLRSFGVKSEKESRALISAAGFKPIRRDFNYQIVP